MVVDIGTGKSWRHLNGDPRVHAEQQFVPIVWGEEVYSIPAPGMPYTYLGFGSDGIALGADGKDLYWTPLSSRTLYSIPTARLRDQSNSSEVLAQAAVQSRGQKGVNDGMETDTNGFIYLGSVETEAVNIYNPANGTVVTFVRDPRINWVDTSKCCYWKFCRVYVLILRSVGRQRLALLHKQPAELRTFHVSRN